ncbi:hypothetical protein ACFC1R_22660 [Kitasatospora sp. NPDC056138]|uniref:hypothetical protein n=1 Tax=Kitasatospora sp. NPDC056138 TaxID=3345724 RepID=UPI0035E3A084
MAALLPSYSPEPGPDGPVNTDLERSLPAHGRAREQPESTAEARRFVWSHQRRPCIVRGCLGGPQVRYALEENQLSL